MKRQQEIYQDQLLIPSQRQLCTLRTGVRMQSTVAKTRGSGNTSKVQIPAVLLPGCVTCPPLLRRHSQDLPHGVVQGIKQNNHGMCLAHIKCCCHFFFKIRATLIQTEKKQKWLPKYSSPSVAYGEVCHLTLADEENTFK